MMGQKKHLIDHRLLTQRRMQSASRNRQMVGEYGEFIEDLRPWSLYMTITFRDQVGSQRARAAVEKYLRELEAAAGNPIAWVMAEDVGKVGGRFHCHLLIDGVDHLSRKKWWRIAHSRFGRTEIRPFDDSGKAAFYVAQNGLSEAGDFHFGGTLSTMEKKKEKAVVVGKKVVARSADVQSELFHLNQGRRRRK